MLITRNKVNYTFRKQQLNVFYINIIFKYFMKKLRYIKKSYYLLLR